MAVLNHDTRPFHGGSREETACVLRFCFFWVVFFILIAAGAWLADAL